MLGKTSTARQGNSLSAVAMLIAILVTLLDSQVLSLTEIFVTILCPLAASGDIASDPEVGSTQTLGFSGTSARLPSLQWPSPTPTTTASVTRPRADARPTQRRRRSASRPANDDWKVKKKKKK